MNREEKAELLSEMNELISGSEAGRPFPHVSSMSFQTGMKTPGHVQWGEQGASS